MTVYPWIQINGIDMDDPINRWAVVREQPYRNLPGVRTTSVVIPGRSGALWPAYDPYDQNAFRLSMIVFGDGADKGEITTNLETNLESLHFLMSQTPVEISYALGPDSSDVRVAHGRLSSVTTPNVFSGRDYATVDYIFDIPDVFWRSADLLTSSTNMTISSSTSSYSPVSLSMLSGSTAPIDDMEIVVGGPFTRLDIVGNRLGSNGKPNWSNNNLVRITANITSSQAIYVDCANMQVSRQSKVNPTWNQVTSSGDLTGAVITAGLESSMSWLKLWPDASDGTFSNPDDRQMFISMTGLNTGSSNHFVAMRGRSCWL